MDRQLVSGLDLHKAIQAARRQGATVEEIRRTGEYRFRHPLMPKPCRVDGHRKDTPRHLIVWLRRLARKQAA
jgi:hypothetical protein